jgi:uncharacterized protein (DUF1499 family)
MGIGYRFRMAACAALLIISLWGFNPSTVSAYPLIPQNTMAFLSFPGTRPSNLGVNNGQLAACPNTPNCVSSQVSASDKEHGVTPIAFVGEGKGAIAKLKTIIENSERTTIIEASDNYLYAEFASSLMGFVDDVEFYADDSAKVIHVRSASRLGQSDLGVNRKRVEELRSKLA